MTVPSSPVATEIGLSPSFEVNSLRQQLTALQQALQVTEQAAGEYRKRVECGFWSFGSEPSPFIHNLPCIAFLKDEHGRYVYVNDFWEKAFGFTLDQWHGRTDEELWPHAVARKLRSNDAVVRKTSRPLQTVETIDGHGDTKHWLLTTFPAGSNSVGGVGIDITGRRLAEEALRESEQRYRDLFRSTVVGIYRTNPQGQVMLANPALVQILGIPVDSVIGAKLSDFEDCNDCPPLMGALSSEGQVRGFETCWLNGSGHRIYVRHNVQRVTGPSGETLWYDGVVEDITALKMADRFEKDRSRLLEMVARNEDADALLHELCLVVERQLPGARCLVLMRRGNRLYVHVAPSFDDSFRTVMGAGLPIGPHEASSGTAAFLNAPVVVSDVTQDPLWSDYREIAEQFSLRSCWSVPIRRSDYTVVGVLAVHHDHPIEPDAAQLELLSTSSHLAAVALEHRQLYEDLSWQAAYDCLTGLPNRASFEDRLEATLVDARWHCDELAILWIDLDRFKQVNDSLGHRIGDALLCAAASRIANALPKEALLARLGGDEFAVLLDKVSGREAAAKCAQDVLDALKASFQIEQYELFTGASIGIVMFPEHGNDSAVLMRSVDAAMYRAKNDGRNRFAFYEDGSCTIGSERLELESDLRRAIDSHEFELFYQPQVDDQGRLHAFEALLRWNHPKHGLLTPGRFIGIAEETGLIVPIGKWALREAARQCAEWRSTFRPDIRVAVNVSALQFYYADFDQTVVDALNEYHLPADALELELTESLVVRDFEECRRQMKALRAAGIAIAIDDFGTGYSSLSHLHKLPVSRLKIDRSFFDSEQDTCRAIIRSITQLAHSLGISVVMEGVETQAQLDACRESGVDLSQGYLLGRPVPADIAERALACAPVR